MNTARLKAFAPKARRDLIRAVTDRAHKLGLTKNGGSEIAVQGDTAIIEGQPYPRTIGVMREVLRKRIAEQGFDRVMDAAAYTWFNRLMALRFMEVQGYLDHGFCVLSDPTDLDNPNPMPQILREAEHVELPGVERERVVELKLHGNKDAELYALLLKGQCRALHEAMPFLFEAIDDDTELLLPENLLHSGSIVRGLVNEIDAEDWQSIEVVGWLYQFYISEKADEVIGKVVRPEDIPAATQLFTPNWIVRYMVQNTIGAQWLATYPASPLRNQMEFYVEPAEQMPEVNARLAATIPTSLNPESMTLMDPACGSGHILVEAYDLFKAIYLECGYRQRDVATLILEKNLFGLDIDERAAQLTGFALLMKGRADDRRLLDRVVRLNVLVLQRSAISDVYSFSSAALSEHGVDVNDVVDLVDLFREAAALGSLLRVPPLLAHKLPALHALCKAEQVDLLSRYALARLQVYLRQATLLARTYDAVVANPPYMGAKYYPAETKKWLSTNYRGYDGDLFSAFIVRLLEFSRNGYVGMMTQFVWMFTSTYEQLRKHVLTHATIQSLVQLHYDAFAEAKAHPCTFVARPQRTIGYRASFVSLTAFPGASVQASRTRDAIRDRNCSWFFETKPDNFMRLPGWPMAYWVTKFEIFELPPLKTICESGGRTKTHNDEKFVRCHWEVAPSRIGQGKTWVFYEKGGDFRRWYGERYFVVNWTGSARAEYDRHGGLSNSKYWSRGGITWSDVTSATTGFRVKRSNAEYSSASPTVFLTGDTDPDALLALLNSTAVAWILRILNPTLHVNPGDALAIPLPPADLTTGSELASLGQRSVAIATADYDSSPLSADFSADPLLSLGLRQLVAEDYERWRRECESRTNDLLRLESTIESLTLKSYGLSEDASHTVSRPAITLRGNRNLGTEMTWSMSNGIGFATIQYKTSSLTASAA